MSKSTNAEIEQRVNKIYELLINSWNRYDIVQYGSKNWNITDRQVDDYIAMAKEIIKERGKQTREEWITEAKNRHDDRYKKAMSQKDIHSCRLEDLAWNKISGNEHINVDIDGSLDVNVNITKKEV